ncbi:MAG TPA: hypothetical protein VM223_27215 [Planctomycetota bacterium]|nr:hypothetical protein [Planctomycetota bacterium]
MAYPGIQLFPCIGAVRNATGAADGTGSLSGTHSFLVVAWWRDSESNIYHAGVVNNYIDSSDDWGDIPYTAPAVVNIDCTSKEWVALSWDLPKRGAPHHISVYQQTTAGYSLLNGGDKVALRSSDGVMVYSDGKLPGDATGCRIYSFTGLTTEMNAIIQRVDTVNKTITICGNRVISFSVGDRFDVVGDTTYTVDDVGGLAAQTLIYDKWGICTKITVTATPSCSERDVMVYDEGPALFYPGDAVAAETWGVVYGVRLNDAGVNLQPTVRPVMGLGYNDRLVPVSFADDHPIRAYNIDTAALAASVEEWRALTHWVNIGALLLLYIRNDGDTDDNAACHTLHTGALVGYDYEGHTGKRIGHRFPLQFIVDGSGAEYPEEA